LNGEEFLQKRRMKEECVVRIDKRIVFTYEHIARKLRCCGG
jgi:hypothetical protein